MRRDDRDDPFDEFFREIERMMNDMMTGEGDIHMDGERASDPAATDIHLDIYEEDDHLRVVADVPGVDKDAIDLKCDGDTLTIDATSDVRDYHDRVRLPSSVDEHSARASYNNGILEVTFDRADESADIDFS